MVELDIPATLLQRAVSLLHLRFFRHSGLPDANTLTMIICTEQDSLLSLLVRELHPQSQEKLRAMAVAADKRQLGMLSWPSNKTRKTK